MTPDKGTRRRAQVLMLMENVPLVHDSRRGDGTADETEFPSTRQVVNKLSR